MYATIRKQNEIIERLLDKGADANAKDNNGKTALMHAAFLGNLETMELLLNNNADTSIKCNCGKTALIYALENEQAGAANLLLDFIFNDTTFPKRSI